MRTYLVRFSKQAAADLQTIFTDILPEAGEHVASDFVGRLYGACMTLAVFPARGNRYDDIRPGLRIIGYRRQATIAFVVRETDVIILRVFRRGVDVHARLSDASSPDEDE